MRLPQLETPLEKVLHHQAHSWNSASSTPSKGPSVFNYGMVLHFSSVLIGNFDTLFSLRQHHFSKQAQLNSIQFSLLHFYNLLLHYLHYLCAYTQESASILLNSKVVVIVDGGNKK